MTRFSCRAIEWGTALLLGLFPLMALFYLIDIEAFARLARAGLALPIQWQTVQANQLYLTWGVTVVYLSLGFVGLYFLWRAFRRFSRGEWFSPSNSLNLKRFAVLLFAQACLKPVHGAIASIILSANHPAGQKVLSVTLGSNELRNVAIALLLWVIAELLVEGKRLEDENKAFV